jgi:transposase
MIAVADDENEIIIERVAALDLGKAEVYACVRTPHESKAGKRVRETRRFSTMTGSLLELRDWLVCQGITRVVMEATGDYWKAPFYLLEDAFETWLVDPSQVKNLPGRPKTDRLDAEWLARCAERQLLRPCFVPDKPMRRLRDLTRYAAALTHDRTREKQRLEKVLEDACVKLDVVVSDLHGVSGRAMIEALIAGQRDPRALAELARGSMRGKREQLIEALTGHFTDHHAFICRMMLDNIDRISGQIQALTAQIEEQIAPFAPAVHLLDEIPGIGQRAAYVIIAEIGVDMSRFPTPAHLASWAGVAPMARQSGRRRGKSATGHGDAWLKAVLGEAVMAIAKTDTFLSARYRRIAKKRGKQKALVAVARTLLTIIWHLLSDLATGTPSHYRDLGSDWYATHVDKQRRTRRLLRELRSLGYDVALTEQPA